MTEGITYAAAGVDTEAGDKAVELMKAAHGRTHGPQVLGGAGGSIGGLPGAAVGAIAGKILSSDRADMMGADLLSRAADITRVLPLMKVLAGPNSNRFFDLSLCVPTYPLTRIETTFSVT